VAVGHHVLCPGCDPARGCPRCDPFRSLLPALLKPQPRKKPRTSGASPMSGLWSAVNDSARQRGTCASEARTGILGTHHTLEQQSSYNFPCWSHPAPRELELAECFPASQLRHSPCTCPTAPKAAEAKEKAALVVGCPASRRASCAGS